MFLEYLEFLLSTIYYRIDVMWIGKGDKVLSWVFNVLLDEGQIIATKIELNVESQKLILLNPNNNNQVNLLG